MISREIYHKYSTVAYYSNHCVLTVMIVNPHCPLVLEYGYSRCYINYIEVKIPWSNPCHLQWSEWNQHTVSGVTQCLQ